jgi:hypothetical protein
MAEGGGWSVLAREPTGWDDGAPPPVPAYSEFLPAPLVARKPTGAWTDEVRIEGDEHGWRIPAREAMRELTPGLAAVAAALAPRLIALAAGVDRVPGLSRDLLDGNPYLPSAPLPGPPALAVVGLALTRTQDDKGRVRWTLLGGSERGPAAAWWAGLFTAPGRAVAAASAATRLAALAGVAATTVAGLARAGVRILPIGDRPSGDGAPWFGDDAALIPPSLAPLIVDGAGAARARVIVTFRPWAALPPAVQAAAATGAVRLAPAPASLVFAGHRGYRRLAAQLDAAMQLPLLRALPEGLAGLRVPPSGWIDQGGHAGPVSHGGGPTRLRRPHRWQRVRRDADDHAALDYDDAVADALFSTDPVRLGLCDKPIARNAQVWTSDYRLVLDGPTADRAAIAAAARTVFGGGHFGYRLAWPAMMVGARSVVWHRPLVFALTDGAAPRELGDGSLVATAPGRPPIELWPRADVRPAWRAIERGFADHHEARYDVRKLLDARARLGAPLAPSLATRLVSADRDARWSTWRRRLPGHASAPRAAAPALRAIDRAVAEREPPAVAAATFAATATRDFELRYWRTIAGLAHATWRAKNNADGVAPSGPGRDLDPLADELARRHQAAIARHGLVGRAVVGHQWFRWTTDFDLPWSQGWVHNQLHGPRERNVVCVIPGRDRGRAWVLADHYDTAYMEDVYDGKLRGLAPGTRHAAAGADDNHSATAALLLAADVLLPLAAAGRLTHDVWLVHLTGEEFPGDSLGARHLARALAARTLELHEHGSDRRIDLRGVELAGALIMDMIAHKDDRAGERFQISPGDGAAAMHLAAALHASTLAWNRGAARWNRAPARAAARPYRRRARGVAPPAVAPHPIVVGELRPHWHWSSTVFNTDAQCLSDLGLPVVLMMEHYDIDRRGYHDTLDTLANIDLDFGAALAAIAIETIARLASG